MEQNIHLPALGRDAELRAATFDEGSHTIEIVWTTGAKVRRRSWVDGPYDEELVVEPGAVRLDRLNAGAAFLNTHDSYELGSVIGSVVPGSAKIEAGRGIAQVQLSRREDVAGIVQDIRDGVIRFVSVGYRIHTVEKTETDDGSVPVWRVVDWEPLEISAVPIPADPGAVFRSAVDNNGEKNARTYPVVVRSDDPPPATTTDNADANRAAETGDNTMSEQTAADEARGNDAAAQAVATDAARREAADTATKAERARVKEITDIARSVGMDDLVSRAVDQGTCVDEFRKLVIDAVAERQSQRKPETERNVNEGAGHTRVMVGTDEAEKRAAAIENALMHRADPAANPLKDGREFRGMSLLELARDSLEVRGIRTRGMSRMEVARLSLSQADQMRLGGLMTTSDFPGILANISGRTLRAGYDAAPQTFRPLVREVTVPDFKPVTSVQLGDAPNLEKVNEHGEFKRGTMGEAGETYKIATYGKIVGITRQVIVNDDLGAFTRIPRAFGVQAANLESDLVWGQITGNPLMSDGYNLFDSSHHHNDLTAAAPGVTSIAAGRTAMSQQVGLDGTTLTPIDAAYILIPKVMEVTVEQFLGTFMPNLPGNVVPDSIRKLRPISDPRLDRASATTWYLTADAAVADLIELAYLEGQQGVYTETRMGFDIDGMEVKARLDVGAKVVDWRAISRNVGA
ncbi:MAG: HK97 family phage prohead protease [Alsobacter sp.]